MSRDQLDRVGWLLFLGSALGFLVSTVRAGDVPGIAASVLFLLGVLAFLLPAR